MKYTFLLCLCACGAPFEVTHHVMPEGGADHPEGASPETGRDAQGETAPPTDAPLPIDAGHDVVTPPIDAGHDSPTPPIDSGCALPAIPTPAVYGVSDVSQYGISLNGGGWYTGTPTPEACRCAATYNCVCLETSAPSLVSLCIDPMFPRFNSCFMDGTVPVVTCY